MEVDLYVDHARKDAAQTHRYDALEVSSPRTLFAFHPATNSAERSNYGVATVGRGSRSNRILSLCCTLRNQNLWLPRTSANRYGLLATRADRAILLNSGRVTLTRGSLRCATWVAVSGSAVTVARPVYRVRTLTGSILAKLFDRKRRRDRVLNGSETAV